MPLGQKLHIPCGFIVVCRLNERLEAVWNMDGQSYRTDVSSATWDKWQVHMVAYRMTNFIDMFTVF